MSDGILKHTFTIFTSVFKLLVEIHSLIIEMFQLWGMDTKELDNIKVTVKYDFFHVFKRPSQFGRGGNTESSFHQRGL